MTVLIATLDDTVVTDALVALLRSWPGLSDMGATVEDAEELNESPERCPWVGVYRSRLNLAPRVLGMGGGYRMQRLSIAIVLQAASTDSGRECRRRLGALVRETTSALCSDQGIGGTVDAMEDIDVVYTDYSRAGTMFSQQAVATFTALAPVTATVV